MDNHQIDQWAREEIQNREIQPRPMVWEKLEMQLDKEKTSGVKPRIKVIFWISGLFVAGLVWYGLFSESRQPAQKRNMQDETRTSALTEESTSKTINTPDTATKPEVTTPRKEKKVQHHPVRNNPPAIIKNKPADLTPQGLEVQRVPTEPEVKKGTSSGPAVAVQEANPSNQANKTEILPSQMQNALHKTNHDFQVDSRKLLQEVSMEIAKTTPKYQIDPASLLKEVEKEANNSFLQKVFKTVTETSNSVYAAVTTRNVEP